MKPHVLFAAYQVDRGSNGGMESATQIFEALASDFQWTLLTNRESARTERWRSGGAKVVRFSFAEDKGKLSRGLNLCLAAAKALRQQADILHANDIRAAQILLPAARIKKTPLAFTMRGMKTENETYGLQWQRVAQQLDALITLSNDMAHRIAHRLPVAAERQHTIPSIVDFTDFEPLNPDERLALRAKLGITKGEIAIGIVGGVFDIKRQLEAISKVVPHLADLPCRLHLVGDFNPSDDPYSFACAKAVKAEGLEDRVVFHGFRKNVAEYLASLDVVLVTSRREGLARCMIEAMSCGTPVVSMDVCSAREILEPTGAGVVVGLDDWMGVVEALRTLTIDAEKRALMGWSGRKAALSLFSKESVIKDWRNLYSKLSQMRVI